MVAMKLMHTQKKKTISPAEIYEKLLKRTLILPTLQTKRVSRRYILTNFIIAHLRPAYGTVCQVQMVISNHLNFRNWRPGKLYCIWNVFVGVSTLGDLLSKPILRYATWTMAVITCLGNGLVLWGRFTHRDESRAVSMVIRNLAVADLLMGFYLSVIGVQDYRFRENYNSISFAWIGSWGCIGAGILAMISSEVSLLILTFISVERFLLIADPFGGHRRLTTHNVLLFLFTIWLTGIAIAIWPGKIQNSEIQVYY